MVGLILDTHCASLIHFLQLDHRVFVALPVLDMLLLENVSSDNLLARTNPTLTTHAIPTIRAVLIEACHLF